MQGTYGPKMWGNDALMIFIKQQITFIDVVINVFIFSIFACLNRYGAVHGAAANSIEIALFFAF